MKRHWRRYFAIFGASICLSISAILLFVEYQRLAEYQRLETVFRVDFESMAVDSEAIAKFLFWLGLSGVMCLQTSLSFASCHLKLRLHQRLACVWGTLFVTFAGVGLMWPAFHTFPITESRFVIQIRAAYWGFGGLTAGFLLLFIGLLGAKIVPTQSPPLTRVLRVLVGLCAIASAFASAISYSALIGTSLRDPASEDFIWYFTWLLRLGIFLTLFGFTQVIAIRLASAPPLLIDKSKLGNLSLPRRLSDPLMVFSRLCIVGLLFQGMLFFTVSFPSENEAAMTGVGYIYCLGMFWIILPKQSTNAIYLRSFRRDYTSFEKRLAIQRLLGWKYRLSGIRAPSNRWPKVVQYIFSGFLCFRYSTVKYMNLEADEDWFSRLWRSMAEARCVFVDVSDVTPEVEREIVLAHRCVGPRRVMFVADELGDESTWRARVTDLTGMVSPNVAIWPSTPSGDDLALFEAAISKFESQLPTGAAGLDWNAFECVRASARWRGRWLIDNVFVAAQALVGIIIAIVTYWALMELPYVRLFVSFIFVGYLAVGIVSYLKESVGRQRVIFAVYATPVVLFLVWLFLVSLDHGVSPR